MSHSARLADYRAALTTPGARGAVVAAIFARLPIAMIGLSLLLYVQRETGAFATAGLVSAGVLVGVALGSVVQGRLMDRLGPTRPLLVSSSAFVVLATISVLAVEAHAKTWVLVLLALGVGFSQPTVGSASRAMWPRLVPAGSVRQAAYAYEAISMEVFFILGPALAGVLLAAPWPGTGVVAGSACMALGSIWFALTPLQRGHKPDNSERTPDLLGALASPGMRTIAIAALGFGVTVGLVEVAVPAAATHAGSPSMSGLLLGLFSVSSVLFGVFYASHPWPRDLAKRLPVLLGAFSVLIALLAIPSTLLGLAGALLLAGTMITPQSTAHSATIEVVAPKGTVTEAFAWVITSVTFGLAGGQSLSGQLVDHVGVWASFLVSAGFGVVFAVVLWLRRGTIREYQRPSRNTGLVSATMVSGVVEVGTGLRTSARTKLE
ncbi:MFS transporter [Labedaea rhizosphaerae]|uniref:Putative MFS family arabinose efflux permease n=1 Tax=Labedaea rhizosphaerae TaxID=598644 RepID=A0A4R6SLE9_LABRH|nr:MFS transporter [Labedaea rhizosphaerae]TDQ04777.1 putative MFS family arabinose efflux permease [Labedaea rhizosphaerae]